MYQEGDHVRIKGKNVVGDIIHIYKGMDGETRCIVESDEEGPIDDPDAWNEMPFPQFFCAIRELEPA